MSRSRYDGDTRRTDSGQSPFVITSEESQELRNIDNRSGKNQHLTNQSTTNNIGNASEKRKRRVKTRSIEERMIRGDRKNDGILATTGNTGEYPKSSFLGMMKSKYQGLFTTASEAFGRTVDKITSVVAALETTTDAWYERNKSPVLAKGRYAKMYSAYRKYQADPKRLEKRATLISYLGRKIEYPALITVLKKKVRTAKEEEQYLRNLSYAYDLLESARDSGSEVKLKNTEDYVASLTDDNLLAYETDHFLLQSVARPDQEKFQIHETFGERSIVFYDRRVRIYQFQGILYNANNVRWRDEFISAYENYFRGTKVAENNYRMLLTFDEIMLEGALINMDIVQMSEEPNSVRLSFGMYVKNEILLAKDLIKVANSNASEATDPNVSSKERYSPPKRTPGEVRAREDDRRTRTGRFT